MESPRYLRIVLPPFVFYGAVILAEVLNGNLVRMVKGWGDSAGVIAGIVAASIVPLGYVIGGVTLLILSEWGRLLRRLGERWGWPWVERIQVGYGRYDLPYKPEETRPLLDDLKMKDAGSADDHLNAARTFVYEARDKWWLADYVNRLWDASMAYSGSVFALLLSIAYACYTSSKSWLWLVIALAAIAVCVFMACYTRKEMRKAVTFQIDHRDSTRKAVESWKPLERKPHQTANQ